MLAEVAAVLVAPDLLRLSPAPKVQRQNFTMEAAEAAALDKLAERVEAQAGLKLALDQTEHLVRVVLEALPAVVMPEARAVVEALLVGTLPRPHLTRVRVLAEPLGTTSLEAPLLLGLPPEHVWVALLKMEKPCKH